MRLISHGGGVQTTALTVLVCTGRLHADCAVFANVGDDSEMPATLTYMREVMVPYAAAHGFPIHEVGAVDSSGEPVTLRGKLMKDGSRSVPIPVRGPRTGAPGTRSCTVDFKIVLVDRWCREHGATEAAPFTKLIGFSTDEMERAAGRRTPMTVPEYPLIKELRLDRSACEQVIRDAGLPVPPKSSCYFCPFHRLATWSELRRDEPELFADAVLIEATLNRRRATQCCAASVERATRTVVDPHPDGLGAGTEREEPIEPGSVAMCPRCEEQLQVQPDGTWPEHMKGPLYMTRVGKPLPEAIHEAQPALWDLREGIEGCDDASCFT